MLLYLFGAAATLVATYFIFRTANENGRSGVLWALVGLAAGFGFQIVMPVIVAIVLGIGFILSGTPQSQIAEKLDCPSTLAFYVCWVLSFVMLFLVLKFVANQREFDSLSDVNSGEVPPPPTFQ